MSAAVTCGLCGKPVPHNPEGDAGDGGTCGLCGSPTRATRSGARIHADFRDAVACGIAHPRERAPEAAPLVAAAPLSQPSLFDGLEAS